MAISPNDYTTTTAVKAHMENMSSTTAYDSLLSSLITRASRAIDRYTLREPGAYSVDADEVRYFDGSGTTEQMIDELSTTPTTVAVDESGSRTYTSWASTQYDLWPYNADQFGQPYIALKVNYLTGDKDVFYAYPKSVKITGKWGYSTSVPDDVHEATITQVARHLKRGQQAFQDVGAIQELGQFRFVDALDPEVKQMVKHLRRLAV